MEHGLFPDAEVGEPSWWPMIGFRTDPYDTLPLEGDEDSAALLVGRERNLAGVFAHLRARSTHLTIDGPNGSGKTSVLRCVIGELNRSVENFTAGQLLVPVGEPISPGPSEAPDIFVERAMLAITLTLIEHKAVIARAGGYSPRKLKALKKLARNPLIRSVSGGFSLGALIGMSGSGGATPNTSSSFRLVGEAALVAEALEQAFPATEAGALVACMDDVEKLGGPSEVASYMSDIREPLLNLRGVKWVILGSGGVVEGLGGHRRLTGVLSTPMRLAELPEEMAPEVVERRIENYRLGPRVTVPVGGAGFGLLYKVTGHRLRAALELCQEFTQDAWTHGLLDEDRVENEVEQSSLGPGLRSEVPLAAIRAYLDGLCLHRWDQIGAMGRTAADVLFEVAAAKEIDINSLTIEDVSRKEAVKHLCDEGFLEASSRADDGSGTVLELTAWGYLAVTGGRHAGWPDSLGD